MLSLSAFVVGIVLVVIDLVILIASVALVSLVLALLQQQTGLDDRFKSLVIGRLLGHFFVI